MINKEEKIVVLTLLIIGLTILIYYIHDGILHGYEYLTGPPRYGISSYFINIGILIAIFYSISLLYLSTKVKKNKYFEVVLKPSLKKFIMSLILLEIFQYLTPKESCTMLNELLICYFWNFKFSETILFLYGFLIALIIFILPYFILKLYNNFRKKS